MTAATQHQHQAQAKDDEEAHWALDGSAWPIVHGSRESHDNTPLPTPLTAALHMYNSQGLTPSPSSSSSSSSETWLAIHPPTHHGAAEEETLTKVLEAMRRFLQAPEETGGRGVEDAVGGGGGEGEGGRSKPLQGERFSMADANPVSIITEYVNEEEQRLWTSGFKHVLVFRQRKDEPELEVRIYPPTHSFNHPATHPPTHSSTHPPTHPPNPSSIHSK